ncbi:MAG: sulfite exporter TauE/SafE family protein [Deltaproteobacteria bacterium]|nr:sulfite exporter TauE/SafE family protein [Deltaproteobacteria bacterium]MBW1904176.1 sulfite exporter TauE/SafE family protein [Deltaproteobacteria bacterium]MBW2374732.1 sulfite exporter TauE/SafE family protein [Deltaproteobacteria bacterium]
MIEELSYQSLAILAVAGVLAAVVNVLAGGGGMIVLPALMALGLPADVANGTYRLGVVTQSIAGTAAMGREGKLDTGSIVPILIPTVLGAVVGALLATWVPREVLKPIMLATMVLMAALIVFRKQTLIPGEGPTLTPQEAPRSYVGLFLAGVYGGFIQAGVGFLLLGVLVGTLRHNLITGNALKLVITLAFGSVSLGIFVWAGLVSWAPALVLAAASIVGARLGVRLMLKVPIEGLRWFVFACVVATCIAAWLR